MNDKLPLDCYDDFSTPLEAAIKIGDGALVMLLIAAGGKIDVNLLSLAIDSGNIFMEKILTREIELVRGKAEKRKMAIRSNYNDQKRI